MCAINIWKSFTSQSVSAAFEYNASIEPLSFTRYCYCYYDDHYFLECPSERVCLRVCMRKVFRIKIPLHIRANRHSVQHFLFSLTLLILNIPFNVVTAASASAAAIYLFGVCFFSHIVFSMFLFYFASFSV